MTRFSRLPYYTNCVDWPRQDVHSQNGLCAMIDKAKDITRKTFLMHVNKKDREQLEEELGYSLVSDGLLRMSNDYHVSYHRSTLHGSVAYFFKHSAIEYVFAEAPYDPL